MCGIVGAVVRENVTPFLVEGLQRMEYRGYDSAGIAVLDDAHHLQRVRTQGKVAALVEALKDEPLNSHIGIAHTRWATHGVPSERNAHPHIAGGESHQIAVVHNGIIENFIPLKDALVEKGYTFNSQTDTEVAAYLIYDEMEKGLGLREAVLSAAKKLEGAYALGVISTRNPDHLIAVRSGAPLVVGLGEGENYFASDHLALLPVTQQFVYLDEGDIAEVYPDRVDIYNKEGQRVERPVKQVSEDTLSAVDKGDYDHFMLKEIHEQSSVVLETMQGRLGEHQVFDGVFGTQADAIFANVEQVHIVACGTSYHAGLVARYWIEQMVCIPCQVDVASEYRYRHIVVPKNTLFIGISQSGETADTLAALRKAKELHYLSTLAICNVPESAMVREAALTLLTRAGAEIGVASTKAFMTQLLSLAILTLSLAKDHGMRDAKEHIKALVSLPKLLDKALAHEAEIQALAKDFIHKSHALFVARGTFFPIALEGALKLKEISYIHAEAYPAGELKHGPLALVDSEMPVVAIVHNDHLSEKTLSNLQEIKARGGQLIIFSDIPDLKFPGAQIVSFAECAGDIFTAPMLMTVPMQLLAYHVAVLRETDVDQPRNLAKSVTVE